MLERLDEHLFVDDLEEKIHAKTNIYKIYKNAFIFLTDMDCFIKVVILFNKQLLIFIENYSYDNNSIPIGFSPFNHYFHADGFYGLIDIKQYLAKITSKKNILLEKWVCDAPKPGGPLTTRQPAENLYVSYYETHT